MRSAATPAEVNSPAAMVRERFDGWTEEAMRRERAVVRRREKMSRRRVGRGRERCCA